MSVLVGVAVGVLADCDLLSADTTLATHIIADEMQITQHNDIYDNYITGVYEIMHLHLT